MSECLVHCRWDILRERLTYRFDENPEATRTFDWVVSYNAYATGWGWLRETALYLGHDLPINMTMRWQNGETVAMYHRCFR